MIISKIANTQNGNMYVGVLSNKTSKVSFGSITESMWGTDESNARDAGYDSGYRRGVGSKQKLIRHLRKENEKLRKSLEWLRGTKKNGVDVQKLADLIAERDRHKASATRSSKKAVALEKRLTAIATKLQELTALVKKK